MSAEAARPIRVLIVDDHQILADALRQVITLQGDMEVVGAAASCAAGLELARRLRPDLVLLDVALPDGDGIRLIPEIKAASPDTHVLVLTSLADQATLIRAMQSGAGGFLSKSSGLGDLRDSIRRAATGEVTAPTSLLLGLLSQAARQKEKPPPGCDQLTPRELEIVQLLAEGLSSAEIAARLVIAPLTVRTHIRNILQKLNVRSRLEAVTYAMRCGLIQPPA